MKTTSLLKKISVITGCAALSAALISPRAVIQADDHDYSDTTYWTEQCKSITTASDSGKREACAAFTQYMSSTSSDLAAKLNQINADREEIAANIDDYEKKINDLQSQIDDLASQITDLQNQIDDLQENIDDLEKKEEALKEKIKMQLETSQTTMRISKYVDILAGARSFSDFLTIASGLRDISNHNDNTMKEYQNTVAELEDNQKQLSETKTEKQTAQDDYVTQQYEAEVIQEEYENQKGELDKQYTEAQLTKEALDATAEQLAEEQANAQKAYEAEVERERQAAAARAAAAARQSSSSSSSSSSSQVTPSGSNGGRNYGGNVSVVNDGTLGTQIVQYAMQFLGYPYVWGAAGPNAFDCSGFTQYVYGHFGIYLYHYTGVQETAGYAVSRSEAQAGDLVLWSGHVAIVMGWYNGVLYCINAMNPSAGVCTIPVDWMGSPVRCFRRVI